MGRIDKTSGQDATLERRHINIMLRHIQEYEQVKTKKHQTFKTAQDFYDTRTICKQNFLKYYRRFCIASRDINSLLPHKTGRKFKEELKHSPEIINKIKDIRSKGYNRYDISIQIKKYMDINITPSSVYRLLKKLHINQLNPIIKEEKRRIIKMNAGELAHVDIHYVAKKTVTEIGNQKLYILGIIDDYSRICWLEVLENIKAVNVAFCAMDMLLKIKERYNIEFKEMMSDNGSEFSSRNNMDHPFEKMLSFYNITHRYTKPFSPKTNGKIERFWKTIEDELLSGEEFKTLEEFKKYILGYVIYYNEHRIHQGINNKMPINMLNLNMLNSEPN